MLQEWIAARPRLAVVSLLGLEEGLDDELLVEDAVASLSTGEELSGVGLAGGARLREVLVELERELGSNSEEYTAPGGLVYREIADRDMVARIRDASGERPGNSQPPASYPHKTGEAVTELGTGGAEEKTNERKFGVRI
jgi:hypothetical protein